MKKLIVVRIRRIHLSKEVPEEDSERSPIMILKRTTFKERYFRM